MKILVSVKANSKVESVEMTGKNNFKVRVKAPAREGLANEAVVRMLGDYLGVQKSRISILKGAKNKIKLVNIS